PDLSRFIEWAQSMNLDKSGILRALGERHDTRIETLQMPHLEDYPGAFGDLHQFKRFLIGWSNWFFHKHMHATLEEWFRDLAVINRRYHDAHGVDIVDQVTRVSVGPATVQFGCLSRRFFVYIRHAHQFDTRHAGIDTCVETTEVTDAGYADTQLIDILFGLRVASGGHWLAVIRSPSA